MATLIEMREKRLKLLQEAQVFAEDQNFDTAKRENVNKILADVAVLEGDITTRESLDAKLAEERSATRPPRGGSGGAEQNDAEKRHVEAFTDYIRRGLTGMSPENRAALYATRDVLTTNTGDAFLIPQVFNPTLVEAQKFIGGALNCVTRKVTNNNGAPMRFSLVNDTANTLTTLTEGSALTDTDPSFTGFLSNTDTVATMIKVSIQELADSYFNLETWIRTSFGVRYARGTDKNIILGNASNIASLAGSATLGATAASPTGPVYDDFTACYGALDAAYIPGSKWMMNQSTRASLLGQKDNYGRPLWNVSPNSGTLDMILGQPVVITPNLVNSFYGTAPGAAATGILFGDFEQGYTLRTDGGLSIMRLNERFADSLEVGFIAYMRMGGSATDAGTHPVLSLVTPT